MILPRTMPSDAPNPPEPAVTRSDWSIWPLAIASAVLLIVGAALFVLSARHTRWHYTYPLDDTYIHLAIAKNLSLYGVWGSTRYHFGSLSSSPLWTLILAGLFKLTGVREHLPLALCSILAVACLVVIDRIARRYGVPTLTRAILLLAIVIGAPLPTLALLGMEHLLQILVDVLFVYSVAQCAAIPKEQAGPGTKNLVVLGILAALVCTTRYEGLFLIFAGGLVLLLRRHSTAIASCAIGAILPIGLLGLYSAAHGGMWLPNSVLLKGHMARFSTLDDAALSVGQRAYDALSDAPWVTVPLICAIVLCSGYILAARKAGTRLSTPGVLLLIAIMTTLAHAQFARFGHLYRYEAYLIVLLLLAIAIAVAHNAAVLSHRPRLRVAMAISLSAAVLVSSAIRFQLACKLAPRASINIWEQQCQLADFLKRYYQGQNVAINDIGAAGFFADIRLFDIFGLDDTEVGRLSYRHELAHNTIARIANRRGVKIAVVYKHWLAYFNDDHGLPPWTEVGTWTIANNEICSSPTVTFYAVEPGEREMLRKHLLEYQPQLPPTVTVEIK